MKYKERVEAFKKAQDEYSGFIASVLWKLSGNRELFNEALQYTLLQMWKHIKKLQRPDAGAYIYRIALTANSRAWRNRIGRDSYLKSPADIIEFEENFEKKY